MKIVHHINGDPHDNRIENLRVAYVPEELATELATKAKSLLEGMRRRAGRDPDVADFAVAFERILGTHTETKRESEKSAV
jgi:HNH endonuclease